MNNITKNWYIKKRKLIEKQVLNGEHLAHKRKDFMSPNKKYMLIITPVAFEEDERVWAYTVGKVFKKNKNKTGNLIANIHRNSEKFPFAFFEKHTDGHDYFICGEDYQGQTIIQLDTGKRIDFVGEKAKRNMEFCWQKFHLSPNKKILAVEGFAKNKPKDIVEYRSIRFFNFEKPFELPYEEVGDRISFPYDNGYGWDGDEHFTVSVIEDRRKEDLKRVRDLPEKERLECLKDNNYARRNTVYKVPIEGTDEEIKEVYSEWVST